MRATEIIKQFAARLWRGRDGNFAIMAGILTPVVILAVGYGVNVAQVSITKSNLLAALDSAVTSTARDLTTGVISVEQAPQIVEAFLIANGFRAYAEEGKLHLDELEIDTVSGTVRAKASVDLDVAFALFGTANHLKIVTESAALYSDKKIEVAMMLDVTGSMRGQRIIDLKEAAREAVQLLLDNNRPGRERVRIALVPYADSVNTGVLSHTVYSEVDSSSNPVGGALPLALQTSRPAGNTCSTEREGAVNRHTDAGPDVQMVNRDYRLSFCPVASLMPLTHNRAALLSRIDELVADAYGWTNGRVGIQWSWYLLSPNWAKVLAPENQPRARDPKVVSKYAILMTDGAFNVAFDQVPAEEDFRMQESRNWTNSEALCANMRAQGIEVFTIGFQLGNAAKQVMRNCASPDKGSQKFFYDASTGAELKEAFRSIAQNIENLALTK
jgi:Flp pilus assembly protein TadG